MRNFCKKETADSRYHHGNDGEGKCQKGGHHGEVNTIICSSSDIEVRVWVKVLIAPGKCSCMVVV